MIWEMLTTVLMREASDYNMPDPEECVPVRIDCAEEAAPGEGAALAVSFLRGGVSALVPAVVLRLVKQRQYLLGCPHSPTRPHISAVML